MRTIAITVDDDTLELLKRIGAGSKERRSRSALVRTAIREYAATELSRRETEREREIIRKHRDQLAREAKALIGDQADA